MHWITAVLMCVQLDNHVCKSLNSLRPEQCTLKQLELFCHSELSWMQQRIYQIKALPLPLCNDYVVQSTVLQHPQLHTTTFSICWRSTAEEGQHMMAQLQGLQWKRNASFKKAFAPLHWIHLMLLLVPTYYIYLTAYWHSGHMGKKMGKRQSDDTLEHSTLQLFWRD